MARRVPIEIPPGLKSDDTSFSSQGTYRYGDKVRFYENRAEVIKGWERLTVENVPGIVRSMLQWRDKIQSPLIATGSNTHLYVWRSGNLFDITPIDFLESATDNSLAPGYGMGGYGRGPYGTYDGVGDFRIKTWSLVNYGQSLIANPRRGQMYWWQNNTAVRAVTISSIADALDPDPGPGAAHVPETVDFTLVTAGRQVIAFGCTEEYALDANGAAVAPGIFNPLNIRGSELDGGIATWKVEDDNNCFETQLNEGNFIVTAKMWNDLTIGVWTDTGMHIGTYTGNPGSVYSFAPVPGAVGLAGPNALTIIGSTAYWISNDMNLNVCPLGGQPQQVICPIHTETLGNVAPSQKDKIVLTYLPTTDELRIDYPNLDDGIENSRYLALHIPSQAWSTGKMSRTAFISGDADPIAAEATVKYLGSQSAIFNNETAKVSLIRAQNATPSIAGENMVRRANSTVEGQAAIQDFDGLGQSGWGSIFVGNSSAIAAVRLNDLGESPNNPLSVSFIGQVDVGPPEILGRVEIFNNAAGEELIHQEEVVFVRGSTYYKVENVDLPSNASNVVVRIGVIDPILETGETVRVTDFKVEQRLTSTGWTPDPDDVDLYENYGTFIRDLKYDQPVSNIYYHERGTTADGGAITWSLETSDFSLDDSYSAYMISRFIPDFINQVGPIKVTMEFRMFPQDQNPVLVGPFTMLPGQDRIDLRHTGKIVRFKFEATNSPASCRFGKPLFEITPTGTR